MYAIQYSPTDQVKFGAIRCIFILYSSVGKCNENTKAYFRVFWMQYIYVYIYIYISLHINLVYYVGILFVCVYICMYVQMISNALPLSCKYFFIREPAPFHEWNNWSNAIHLLLYDSSIGRWFTIHDSSYRNKLGSIFICTYVCIYVHIHVHKTSTNI